MLSLAFNVKIPKGGVRNYVVRIATRLGKHFSTVVSLGLFNIIAVNISLKVGKRR